MVYRLIPVLADLGEGDARNHKQGKRTKDHQRATPSSVRRRPRIADETSITQLFVQPGANNGQPVPHRRWPSFEIVIDHCGKLVAVAGPPTSRVPTEHGVTLRIGVHRRRVCAHAGLPAILGTRRESDALLATAKRRAPSSASR